MLCAPNLASLWQVLAVVVQLSLLTDYGHAHYVEMGWSKEHFGPDGPWQGVLVDVQNVEMSLLPTFGGFPSYLSSWFPTRQLCSATNATTSCGVGGMVNDHSSTKWQSFVGEGNYTWELEALNGNITISTNSISDADTSFHVSAMFVKSSQVLYPNGKILSPETGIFNFVSPFASTFGDTNCPNATCDLAGYVSGKGYVDSLSWGMQLGSASLNYPGSLILGGYDKGRAIGPILASNFTDYGRAGFPLIDITIGVETGASPFDAPGYAGLFEIQQGTQIFKPVSPVYSAASPGVPYIALPQPTIDNIVDKLPVHYDQISKYYLWNTTHESYSKAVSSAVYIGFVFAATGQNVTIKVPLRLLNLTLETSVSGLGSPVPYFPVLPVDLPTLTDTTPYIFLGRAFMQAAFWGNNMFGNGSHGYEWLAQAPGPGSGSNVGLGHEPRSIAANAATLDLHSGDSLFNDSWAGHWKPLPQAAAQSNSTQGSQQQRHQPHHGLGGGGIAGVVIGVLALVAIVLGSLFLVRRRNRRSQRLRTQAESGSSETYEKSELPNDPSSRRELEGKDVRYELSNRDLDASNASELQTQERPTELPTSD